MLARRIIACLDVDGGRVVKGTHFRNLRDMGDPADLAGRHATGGADEIVLLDISATIEARRSIVETVRAVAERLFVPLTVGGGIRSADDAARLLDAGADKVSLNSAALTGPDLLTRLAARYGSQAVVVAIDASLQDGRFAVYSRSGSTQTPREAVDWAREAADRGAGEVLLTSIDRDGTRRGFDCPLTRAVATAVPIPVIASGGAGSPGHFVEVFTEGRADAALAASIFHEGSQPFASLKALLHQHDIPVRH